MVGHIGHCVFYFQNFTIIIIENNLQRVTFYCLIASKNQFIFCFVYEQQNKS
jgi:hypothetical protein